MPIKHDAFKYLRHKKTKTFVIIPAILTITKNKKSNGVMKKKIRLNFQKLSMILLIADLTQNMK